MRGDSPTRRESREKSISDQGSANRAGTGKRERREERSEDIVGNDVGLLFELRGRALPGSGSSVRSLGVTLRRFGITSVLLLVSALGATAPPALATTRPYTSQLTESGAGSPHHFHSPAGLTTGSSGNAWVTEGIGLSRAIGATGGRDAS